MTTELEKEFFKVFGIKPTFRYFVQSELPVVGTDYCRPTYDLTKEQFKNFALSRAKGYKLVEVVKIYPEITDRKLLEMICILSQRKMAESEFYKIKTSSTKTLKSYVLEDCVDFLRYMNELEKQDFKHQIQQLFKEEE